MNFACVSVTTSRCYAHRVDRDDVKGCEVGLKLAKFPGLPRITTFAPAPGHGDDFFLFSSYVLRSFTENVFSTVLFCFC